MNKKFMFVALGYLLLLAALGFALDIGIVANQALQQGPASVALGKGRQRLHVPEGYSALMTAYSVPNTNSTT